MTTFTENSPWQDWVDFCREIDSAREGFDPDEAHCAITTWARGLGDVTFAEAVRSTPDWQAAQTMLWFTWNAFGHVPATLREDMLRMVTFEPPLAAIAYRMAHKKLTEAEKRILWDAFESAMPVMREKLASEIGEPQDD